MRTLTLGAALVLAVSCGKGDPAGDSATAVDPVVSAATTAKAIEANPAGADSILKAAGHTRESFQALMYEIAADSTKSATYAAAKVP